MERKTAYQKMMKKKSHAPGLSPMERQKNADVTIQALKGLKSHSNSDLIREFNIIRGGELNE